MARAPSLRGTLHARWLSSSSPSIRDRETTTTTSFVHRRGDHPYGSREYLLVQPAGPNATSSSSSSSTLTGPDGSTLQILATLKAHRNIVFGATTTSSLSSPSSSVADLCPALLRAALDDCSNDGEQPQAVSTLHGLSAWVRACLEGGATETTTTTATTSTVLEGLRRQPLRGDGDDGNGSDPSSSSDAAPRLALQAVTAIATGVPRPGHAVVGQGTYRDGAAAWTALAREFVALSSPPPPSDQKPHHDFASDECRLYQAAGAELVQIELLADTQPAYLASAGGAMARFFFFTE